MVYDVHNDQRMSDTKTVFDDKCHVKRSFRQLFVANFHREIPPTAIRFRNCSKKFSRPPEPHRSQSRRNDKFLDCPDPTSDWNANQAHLTSIEFIILRRNIREDCPVGKVTLSTLLYIVTKSQ